MILSCCKGWLRGSRLGVMGARVLRDVQFGKTYLGCTNGRWLLMIPLGNVDTAPMRSEDVLRRLCHGGDQPC